MTQKSQEKRIMQIWVPQQRKNDQHNRCSSLQTVLHLTQEEQNKPVDEEDESPDKLQMEKLILQEEEQQGQEMCRRDDSDSEAQTRKSSVRRGYGIIRR